MNSVLVENVTEKIGYGISFEALKPYLLATIDLIPEDYRLVQNSEDSLVILISRSPGFSIPYDTIILTVKPWGNTGAAYLIDNETGKPNSYRQTKEDRDKLAIFIKLVKQSVAGKLEDTAKLLRKPTEQGTKQGLMGIFSVLLALAGVFILLIGC